MPVSLSSTASISKEGAPVLIFICFLFLVAFIEWARQYYRLLHIEQSSLQKLRRAKKPDSVKEANDLLDQDKDPSDVIASLRTALKGGGINEERLDFSGRIYWTRYLAGIFVFIGLLGTVWGIASAVASLGISVNNISSAASATDANSSALTIQRWGNLLGGIENLLGGMRSAFSCTIAGLVATLLVSFLNSVYLASARNIETHTFALAEKWFLPLYHAETNSLQNGFVEIKQALDRLEQQQSNALPDWTAPLRDMISAITTLSTTADNLSAGTDAALDRLRTLHTRSSELILQLEHTAQNLQQESTEAAERLQEVSSQAVVQLQEGQRNMQANLVDNETRLSAQQTALTKATQDIVEKYTQISAKYDQISARTQQLVDAAQTFPAYNSHLAGAAQAVSDAATRMETSVDTLRRDLVLAQQEQHLSLKELVANLAESHNTLDTLLRRFEITLADISSVETTVSQRDDLQQLRTTLTAEMQRMQQTLNNVAQKVAQGTEAISSLRTSRFEPQGIPAPKQSFVPQQQNASEPSSDQKPTPWYRNSPTVVAEPPMLGSEVMENAVNSAQSVMPTPPLPSSIAQRETPPSPLTPFDSKIIPENRHPLETEVSLPVSYADAVKPSERRSWLARLKKMFRRRE